MRGSDYRSRPISRAPARPGPSGASGVVPLASQTNGSLSRCSLFGSLANGVEPGRARARRPGVCGLRPPVPAGGPAPPPPPIPRPHRPRRTVLAWVLALGCPDLGHRKRVALPGSTPQHPSANTQASTGRVGGAEGPPPPPPPPPGRLPFGREKVSPLRRSGEPEAACVRRDGGGLRPGARAAGAAARAAGERRAASGDHRPAPDAEQPGEPPQGAISVPKGTSGDAPHVRGRAEERLAFPFPARPGTAFHPDPEGRPRLPRSAARRARAAEGGRRRRPLHGGRRR